jgi:hypothetical protein
MKKSRDWMSNLEKKLTDYKKYSDNSHGRRLIKGLKFKISGD